MNKIVVRDRLKKYEELLIDIDYNSFRYSFELNTTRNITFTVFRTPYNAFTFDILTAEAEILYNGQIYIVKQSVPQMSGPVLSKEVTAQHISLTFQDHVQRNTINGTKTYTIREYLDHGFKGNKLGFSYQVHGDFPHVQTENLGRMRGMDYINGCVDKYNAYVLADNKVWHIYDEKHYFKRTNLVLRYKYNTDHVKVIEDTNDLKTVVKAYGKPKEETTVGSTSDKDFLAVVVYESPNIKIYGRREKVPISDERFTNKTALLNWAKTQIQDVPSVSLDMNYFGDETISERDMLYFIHEKMGYETYLKINRLTLYHPLANKSPEVGFSSKPKDMINIQRRISKEVNNASKKIDGARYDLNNVKNTTELLYNERIIAEFTEPKNPAKRSLPRAETASDVARLKTSQDVLFYPETHVKAVEGIQEIIPGEASINESGLLAASDKEKLDSIENGAQVNNVSDQEKANWNSKQDAFLISPSGKKFKLKVDDKGMLSTVPYK